MKRLLAFAALLGLAACAKPDLPQTLVRAGSEEELAAFRTELVRTFGAEPLGPFATAIQELQLAGMDRYPAAADRARAMRELVHQKTVREVEILGYEARRQRLQGEIDSLAQTLARDLRLQEQKGGDVSLTVRNRIQNVQDILAQLRANLAATEQQLATWKSAPTR